MSKLTDTFRSVGALGVIALPGHRQALAAAIEHEKRIMHLRAMGFEETESVKLLRLGRYLMLPPDAVELYAAMSACQVDGHCCNRLSVAAHGILNGLPA